MKEQTYPVSGVAGAAPRCRALIEKGIEKGVHVGAQVYASLSGEAVVDFAVGEAREGAPMTTESIAPWLSAGKPVAAVAIAQLWEAGGLDWDTPVAAVVPEFRAGGKEAVTFRHILTHTAGFRWVNLHGAGLTWESIIERICAAPLERGWTPGKKAGYHVMTSWYILGEAVRRIDGRPYERYVRESIFEPLGMNDSWVGMPAEVYEGYGDRLVALHDTRRGKREPHRRHDAGSVLECNPGAGAHGPIRELGRFYEMLLNHGAWDGLRLLSPPAVRAIATRQRAGMYDHTFRHTVDWGLGFIVNSNQYGADTVPYPFGRHASEAVYGHGGQQSSVGLADPAHDLAAAVVFNGAPGEARHHKRVLAFLEGLYEDLGLA